MGVRTITVKGNQIGIIGLDEIFNLTKQAPLTDENHISVEKF